MLSGVISSERAIHVNIEIIRTFVRLREFLLTNPELAGRLDRLEKKYDSQFKSVFDAIRKLMSNHVVLRKQIFALNKKT